MITRRAYGKITQLNHDQKDTSGNQYRKCHRRSCCLADSLYNDECDLLGKTTVTGDGEISAVMESTNNVDPDCFYDHFLPTFPRIDVIFSPFQIINVTAMDQNL